MVIIMTDVRTITSEHALLSDMKAMIGIEKLNIYIDFAYTMFYKLKYESIIINNKTSYSDNCNYLDETTIITIIVWKIQIDSGILPIDSVDSIRKYMRCFYNNG